MIIKKYRAGNFFKKDYIELNGQQAEIEHHRQIFSTRLANQHIEFFKVKSLLPRKYFIGQHKYRFKGLYFIKHVESKGVTYTIKYTKPYWRVYVDNQEVGCFLFNQRNIGDITMVATNHEYNRELSELAIAISLKLVDNKSTKNWLSFGVILLISQSIQYLKLFK